MTLPPARATFVTEYLIYVTIDLFRAPFVTDWGVIMTFSLSTRKKCNRLKQKKEDNHF